MNPNMITCLRPVFVLLHLHRRPFSIAWSWDSIYFSTWRNLEDPWECSRKWSTSLDLCTWTWSDPGWSIRSSNESHSDRGGWSDSTGVRESLHSESQQNIWWPEAGTDGVCFGTVYALQNSTPNISTPNILSFFSVRTRRVEIGHILCSRSCLYIYIYVYIYICIYRFPVCFKIRENKGQLISSKICKFCFFVDEQHETTVSQRQWHESWIWFWSQH